MYPAAYLSQSVSSLLAAIEPGTGDVTSFFDQLLNGNPGAAVKHDPFDVVIAMCVSLVLNLVIATIYRRTYKGTRYSQDYVQTLILIGVVTTILIKVVSGNGNIAF